MLRRTSVLALLVAVFACAAAMPARSDDGPSGKHDPCDVDVQADDANGKKKPDPCQNIPEAPFALVYPLAAGAMVVVAVAVTRRRRGPSC